MMVKICAVDVPISNSIIKSIWPSLNGSNRFKDIGGASPAPFEQYSMEGLACNNYRYRDVIMSLDIALITNLNKVQGVLNYIIIYYSF